MSTSNPSCAWGTEHRREFGRRRGALLLEVLISAFLLAVLVIVVLGSFIESLRHHAQYDDANTLTQRGVMASTRIRNELVDAHRQSVHFDGGRAPVGSPTTEPLLHRDVAGDDGGRRALGLAR